MPAKGYHLTQRTDVVALGHRFLVYSKPQFRLKPHIRGTVEGYHQSCQITARQPRFRFNEGFDLPHECIVSDAIICSFFCDYLAESGFQL